MALLELAFDLLEKGGALAGLGGGYVATRVLNRVSKGLEDAKKARTDAALAKAAAEKALELVAKQQMLIEALQAAVGFQGGLYRGTGGQLGQEEARYGERIAQLESRVDGLEDDFGETARENKQSWEQIQRAVGRIEGAIRRSSDD
jgi:hypothetical protein